MVGQVGQLRVYVCQYAPVYAHSSTGAAERFHPELSASRNLFSSALAPDGLTAAIRASVQEEKFPDLETASSVKYQTCFDKVFTS